jgi:hypothetical protein
MDTNETNDTISRDCEALARRIRAYVWGDSGLKTFFSSTRESGQRFAMAEHAERALASLAREMLPAAPATPPVAEPAPESDEAAQEAIDRG